MPALGLLYINPLQRTSNKKKDYRLRYLLGACSVLTSVIVLSGLCGDRASDHARDAVQAIRDYAFKASPYPVILSIEMHASLRFQVNSATAYAAATPCP
eukprot:1796548-Rhodomonas_salina.1